MPPLEKSLLPCPFCGSEAEMLPFHPGGTIRNGRPEIIVRCKECPARMSIISRLKKQAVLTWNQRVKPT